MTIEEECRLSYYEKITLLNEKHGVWLVKNKETDEIYVWKELSIYNKGVYQSLKDLNSRYFPRLIDFIQKDEGQLVIIEEYISGKTLENWISQGGTFSQAYAVWIAEQLCLGIKELHELHPPVIHRDLKPSNIMITNDGNVKIIDFNAAKYNEEKKMQDTILLGTEGFAAPEQYGFGQSDVRTDIYAVGVLLNYMLTGKLPKETLTSGPCKTVIEKSTRLEPSLRFQNVDEILKSLQTISYQLRVKGKNDKKVHCEGTKHGSNGINRFFLPPGFRTKTIWKMLVATLGYIISIYFSCSLTMTNSDGSETSLVELYCMRVTLFVICLFIITFTCNYLNIQKRFKFMEQKNIVTKIIVGTCWCAIVSLCILIAGVLGYQILEHIIYR